jgi:hypothetical protein
MGAVGNKEELWGMKKRDKRIDWLREALKETIDLAEDAICHIEVDLQPEFEKLSETGKLTWPEGWTDKYKESTAAMRLATWWHGASENEILTRAKTILRLTEDE